MRRFLMTLLLPLALGLAPGAALAQNRPQNSGGGNNGGGAHSIPNANRPSARVAIQILVVHATDSENGVDPRLQPLSSSFRYFKYKGYRLLTSQNADVAVGDDASFSIEGGRRLTVTLISKDDQRARVRLEMSNNNDGKLLDTTVSINRDGTFIVAGPKYKDGILMLPLRASY